MTDQIPEDVYEAGADIVTDAAGEGVVSTGAASLLSRVARIGLYGAFSVLLTGAVVARVAPDQMKPVAKYLPDSVSEYIFQPAYAGST